jgi:hypothetical protein
MKHFKSMTIFAAVVVLLALFSLPVMAQDTEEAEDDDMVSVVGTIEFTDNGDIVFTDLDGNPYILAPAGGFIPSIIMEAEEGTYFTLEGTLLNDGDEDNPPTVQVGFSGVLEEFDPLTNSDEDTIPDLEDNCIDDTNEDQLDTDGDGIGDACDEFNVEDDVDNDGVTDEEDICEFVFNPIEEGATEQVFPVDTDGDGEGDACEELDDEEDDDEEEEVDGEGGFYCRNRDIEHPAGGRLAELYEADYSEVIAAHCGDEGTHKIGWGLIRRQLQEEGFTSQTRGNGNGRGNGNANGRGNGNANGRGNGNRNGNGNANGRNG